MAERIDAHHHLWRYNAEEYGWLEEAGMQELQRDFLVPELEREMAAAGVVGAVAVQARQTPGETRWLLDLAAKSTAIRGVVGWAPIAGAEFGRVLEAMQADRKLKGLRHVIQGEPDGFMHERAFNEGMRAMLPTGLVYDLLIVERQLPEAIEFVDRHPRQRFVLDHVAKPLIRAGVMEPWATRMRELARRDNVCCKISGMATEAGWKTWTEEELRPYFDVVLEAFGPERLMAGSDWPVCLAAIGYARWWGTLERWTEGLGLEERTAILGGTASRVYLL